MTSPKILAKDDYADSKPPRITAAFCVMKPFFATGLVVFVVWEPPPT
jgi:hypothetical protein